MARCNHDRHDYDRNTGETICRDCGHRWRTIEEPVTQRTQTERALEWLQTCRDAELLMSTGLAFTLGGALGVIGALI
jgi:hypothetical protein